MKIKLILSLMTFMPVLLATSISWAGEELPMTYSGKWASYWSYSGGPFTFRIDEFSEKKFEGELWFGNSACDSFKGFKAKLIEGKNFTTKVKTKTKCGVVVIKGSIANNKLRAIYDAGYPDVGVIEGILLKQ